MVTLNPGNMRKDGALWSEPIYTLEYERTGGVKNDYKVCVLGYWKVDLYHFRWSKGEISSVSDMQNLRHIFDISDWKSQVGRQIRDLE